MNYRLYANFDWLIGLLSNYQLIIMNNIFRYIQHHSNV